jgi:ribosome-associated protein
MARITVAPGVSIDEGALEEHFVHASGPGGQNVNKVASAVELRFDVGRSSLALDLQARLAALAGRRLTKDGVLIIDARRFRTQERNRADARARLLALLRAAATPPKPRQKTYVPKVEKKKRIEHKKARAKIKRARARPRGED